ncbi:MAG: Gp138 family membrane-puncturing spike protein [Planctomycetota bacterium]|nr:Gp138 family membrane-puncturing spike protein [Planctomycetota bacterium]
MSKAIDRRDTIDTATPGQALRRYVRQEIREALMETACVRPAHVVKYVPATQTAQCLIGFLRARTIETPAGEVETPQPPDPVFARVALLQGSTHSDQVPILPGDTGLLLFADRALDLWYRAPAPAPVDPVNGRLHDQADAIFIPGLSPDAGLSTPALNPLARTIDAPVVNIGAAANPLTGGLIRGGQVSTAITPLVATLSAVPPAVDPATVIALANANNAALLALCTALQSAVSTKGFTE